MSDECGNSNNLGCLKWGFFPGRKLIIETLVCPHIMVYVELQCVLDIVASLVQLLRERSRGHDETRPGCSSSLSTAFFFFNLWGFDWLKITLTTRPWKRL